jgi:P pilus assembly chaperone PapD
MTSLRTILYLTTATLILAAVDSRAEGHLMVHPTRVIFEDRKRTAEVEVVNNGSDETTYRISLVRERMNDRGEFSFVDQLQQGENFADEMIHFSPRQVTLPPGAGQTVRLQVRKPADLADGEYRAHLMFQALPASKAFSAGDPAEATGAAIKIVLTPIVSISIPMIVRQGKTSATLTLADVKVKHPAAAGHSLAISFDIHRGGNRSVYGDLTVSFTPRGGRGLVVGRANGVAVYVPNSVRIIELPLQLPSFQALSGGTMLVSFSEQPDVGGKELARAILDLP